MILEIILFLILCSSIGISEVFAEEVNSSQSSKEGVILTIQTDKKEYYSNEPIKISTKVENTSSEDFSFESGSCGSSLKINGYGISSLIPLDDANIVITIKDGKESDSNKNLIQDLPGVKLYDEDKKYIAANVLASELLTISNYDFVERISKNIANCPMVMTTVSLDAGDSRSGDFVWSQLVIEDSKNYPFKVSPGIYVIRDSFDGLSASLPITLLGDLLPPLKQVKEGIPLEKINCKQNQQLIFKIDNSPACVKPESILKLVERGWTSILEDNLENGDIYKEKFPDKSFSYEKVIQKLESEGSFNVIVNLRTDITTYDKVKGNPELQQQIINELQNLVLSGLPSSSERNFHKYHYSPDFVILLDSKEVLDYLINSPYVSSIVEDEVDFPLSG